MANQMMDLYGKRIDAVERLDKLLDKAIDAAGNPRDLSGSENAEFERCKLAIQTIDSEIQRAEGEQLRKAGSAVRQGVQIDHPDSSHGGFSLSRLLGGVINHQHVPEFDVSAKIKAGFGAGDGFAVPFCLSKTALVGVHGSGGALVGDAPGGLIDALLAPSLLAMLPVTRDSVPRGFGERTFPRVNSTAVAGWVGEGLAAPESNMVFGQIQLTPHNCVVHSRFSRLLLQTSSPAIDAVLQDDMARAISTTLDSALLSGSGVGPEPRGVLSQAGATVLEADFPVGGGGSGNNIWDALSECVSKLDQANAPTEGRSWLISPAFAARLRTNFRIDSDASDGEFVLPSLNGLIGVNYAVHTACPDDTAILCHWPSVIASSWGALSLIVDPYSLAESGLVKIVASMQVDFALRHAAALVKLTLVT